MHPCIVWRELLEATSALVHFVWMSVPPMAACWSWPSSWLSSLLESRSLTTPKRSDCRKSLPLNSTCRIHNPLVSFHLFHSNSFPILFVPFHFQLYSLACLVSNSTKSHFCFHYFCSSLNPTITFQILSKVGHYQFTLNQSLLLYLSPQICETFGEVPETRGGDWGRCVHTLGEGLWPHSPLHPWPLLRIPRAWWVAPLSSTLISLVTPGDAQIWNF